MQRRKWEEEKRLAQLEELQRRERHKEMIVSKRKYEKKEMDRRADEARQKYEAAQENLKTFLENKEKKAAKLLSEICVSQELSRKKRSLEETEKRKMVKEALEEMKNRKEESTNMHLKIETEKLELANVRKEKKDIMEKRKTVVFNR